MATLKYYDTATSEWKTLIVGAKGEKGDTGDQGEAGLTGPQGPEGLGSVNVTAPITNSGTSTEANIGIDLTDIAPIDSPTFTGTVIGAPAEPDANANTAKNFGYIGMPQVILASGDLVLSKAHSGKHIYVTGANQIINLGPDSEVPFEIGTTIVIVNANVTSFIRGITGGSVVSLRLAGTAESGNRTLAPYGMATLVKIGTNLWIASGNGLT
jgi:hypothetical protein